MCNYEFFILILLSTILISCEGEVHFRQIRSHGCGPHPLFKILASTTADGNAPSTEVFKILDQHRELRQDVIDILMAYDDCVRTADGMKFKKNYRQEFYDRLYSLFER